MKSFIHFLYCPFTGLGLHSGYRGDDWLKYRIKIFKEYVMRSLLNQTNQNFTLWISWRKEERDNPIVKEFYSYLLAKLPNRVIFTYNGIIFWDDKFPNDNLLERLTNTLPELVKICQYKQWVYLTIQPSDDCFYSGMVADIQRFEPSFKSAIGYQKGYICDLQTKKMAEYNPTTNPPFYTIAFPKDIFLNPVKHFNYIGPYKSHEYIPKVLRYKKIDKRGFCVGVHGGNISTVWNHPFKGKEVDELDKFGIKDSALIKPRRSASLTARRILNVLPFNNTIRKLYHKLYDIIK